MFKIKNIIFNINISYSTGLEKLYLLYFSNGKIEISDNKIKIFYPANKKNKNNRFEKPKLKKIIRVKQLFKNSNERSINYFINIVKKRKFFSKKDFISSIKSNYSILNISKQV